MQDRILSGKPYGTSVLFFGCRRRDQDFLYAPLLEQWDKDGKIKLVTGEEERRPCDACRVAPDPPSPAAAFSREGKGKVYVQDRLRESADLVWGLLEQGAHFYVCGDASSMAGRWPRGSWGGGVLAPNRPCLAGAVEEALLEIVEKNQELGSREKALAYLEAMRKEDRYQRDVWY